MPPSGVLSDASAHNYGQFGEQFWSFYRTSQGIVANMCSGGLNPLCTTQTTGWTATVIPGTTDAIGNTIVAPYAGNLYVIYRTSSGLKYVIGNGTSWSAATSIPNTSDAQSNPGADRYGVFGQYLGVVYRNSSGVVMDIYNNSTWSSQPVPSSSGAQGSPSADSFNGTEVHVWFGTGSGLAQSWWDTNANTWTSQNISGTSDMISSPAATRYNDGTNTLQHVVYRSSSGGLKHVWWNGFTQTAETIPNTSAALGDPSATQYGTDLQVPYRTATGLSQAHLSGTTWGSNETIPLS